MFLKLTHPASLRECWESSTSARLLSLVEANSRDFSSASTLCEALLGSVSDTKMDIQVTGIPHALLFIF